MKEKVKRIFKKALLGVMLCVLTVWWCLTPMISAQNTELSEDVIILYTNDVHSYIDGSLSYDVIAGVKSELQKEYKHVILADAGDHAQGTAYGTMDKGKSIIELMNAVGYDVATLGNHEFDYNMAGCKDIISWAEFTYLSCNFYSEENGVRGENVLESYKIFDCGNEKIAFVGITTPETFSKSSAAYFQDENGKFIYGISGGDDGAALRQDVQKAVDAAKQAGATKVIALGHLGVDPSSAPWTSKETISGISGLDAFIDGHSHTVMKSEMVEDQDGNQVLLTQTGEYFNRIGIMHIDAQTGVITTDFIELTEDGNGGYSLSSCFFSREEVVFDASVREAKEAWMDEIYQLLGQKIGSLEVTLDNYDSEGNRLVRSQETNSGDFVADALYYLFDEMGLDVDVAVMNGGGIRNQAITGEIDYKNCKDIHPFGNVACLQTVSGQQILDMLEWGSRYAGESENGSFLHVSGLTYKINTAIPDTTVADEMNIWVNGPSAYRVYDVKIYNKETDRWEPLNLNAKYNLAGYNYTLRDLGDGFAMLNDSVNVLDYVMEDYMVLGNYIMGFENGVVGATNSPLLAKYPGLLIDYGKPQGCGRIVIVTEQPSVPDTGDNGSDIWLILLFVGGLVTTAVAKGKKEIQQD